MEESRAVVARVAAFDDPGRDADALLTLDSGEKYRVGRKARLFGTWSRILRDLHRSGELVYVGVDTAAGTVNEILFPGEERIKRVAPRPEGDRLKVVFLMSPSLHYLRTGGPRFEEMRRILEEAARTGARPLVTCDPDTQEIRDVRWP